MNYGPKKERYFQPTAPWFRIGLNVIKYFPNDNSWLDMNDKAWPVAFHGVGRDIKGSDYAALLSNVVSYGLKVANSVPSQAGLKPGN